MCQPTSSLSSSSSSPQPQQYTPVTRGNLMDAKVKEDDTHGNSCVVSKVTGVLSGGICLYAFAKRKAQHHYYF